MALFEKKKNIYFTFQKRIYSVLYASKDGLPSYFRENIFCIFCKHKDFELWALSDIFNNINSDNYFLIFVSCRI